MKKFLLFSISILIIASMHAQVTIGVTPYTTLQAAFAAINAGTHTGAITIKINGNTTETASCVLNSSGTGSANYTSVQIYPTVSGLKISGFLNTALISLNGADNVTIDGRVNATGSTRDLKIINTSTGNFASTIFLIESAQNNVVEYCKLSGATTNVNSGVIYLSTATVGTGNDNNLFDNNSITGVNLSDVNRPLNAFSSLGVNTIRDNSNNTISNNDIFDFAKTASSTNGILLSLNNSSWTITGNNIYQTTPVVTTASTSNVNAININNTGTGYVISNNFIGGSAPACGGAAWTVSGSFTQAFQGMIISSGGCSIDGNTISNFNWTTTAAIPFEGIKISGGSFSIGSGSGNIIGSASGTGSIQATNSTATGITVGIHIATTGNGTIANNFIGGFTVTGAAGFCHNLRGILKNSTGVLTITGNVIGSTTTANSFLSQSASVASPGQSVIGITNNSTGTVNASGNIIANFSNNYAGTDAAGQIIGIRSTNGTDNFTSNTIYNLSTSSANAGTDASASVIGISQNSTVAGNTVSGNTIYNLSNTNGTATVSVYGIFYQGATTGTNAVAMNLVHSLSVASSAAASNITGIFISSGTTTYSNNIITLGTGVNTGYSINGIADNAAAGNNTSLYFNTVYIGGTPSSGSNSAALLSNSNVNTRDIRDNIFCNGRSGGASHYAAYFNYASVGSLTLDYNDYRATGTGGVLGFFNSANVAALPLIAAEDANSITINPLFPNAGGTLPTDYLPSAALPGITIAGISTDYQSTTRGATPTIGALETACTPPPAPANTTPAANLTICFNTSTTLSASGLGTLSWYSAATGGTYLGSGGTFTTANLTANTDFFVQDSTCAASVTRTMITVAVSVLTITPSQTNVTCNGNTDGTATVAVSGGTPGYTYSWTSGGSAATETNLAAGNYTCTITDANTCSTTQTFTITAPSALSGVRSRTNVSCFGGSDGTATVVVSGGTAPYSYSWAPSGGTGSTATGLSAGGYTVTITDANSCTLALNYTIIQPSAINDSPGQTDVSCNGGNNGIATVAPFGGTGPYTFSWAPSGGTNDTATGLAAGNYTCTITDANGCTFAQAFFITEPAVISDVPVIGSVSCNGGSDGTITTSVSGGTGPYTYAWLPGGETTSSLSGLVIGSYSVIITDVNGCTLTETLTVTEPAVLSAVNSQTDNSCNGGNNGSATVTVSGGTAPYSYSWSPSGGTAATASGLAAGGYTVNITDANSCTLFETFTITEPSALSAISSQTNVSCSGGNNGTATVNISGGTPGYTYSWAPSGGTAATASGLSAGNYTVTVTDAASCTFTVSFTITEPATALSVISSQVNISCNGGSDGSASVVVSGGIPGYTYAWAPSGGTGSIASSLGTGTYSCTITDANTCSTTATFNITEPAPITAGNSQTNVSCFGGNNGSATVSVSGGTPGYTYNWMPSGGSGATASGLSAGTYTCTITDANSCSVTSSFTITEPATALSAINSQTDVTCNGGNNGTATVVASGGVPAYSYAWAPGGGTAATASGLTAGNYTCTITDAGSCAIAVTFTITEPIAFTVTSSQTNVSCSGNTDGSATVTVSGGTSPYTYSWAPSGGTGSTASSLAAGNYTVIITDANTCTTTATFNITEPVALSSTTTQTNLSCNGGSNGSATVSVSGGTPAYTYSWAPSGGTAATASGLSAGNYTCTITDANSCTTTATVTLTEPSAFSVSTSQTNISCNGGSNGSASVFVSGATPGYTYFWTPSGGTSSTASSLGLGTYTCTITDANSCITTATVTITEPAALTITNSQTDLTCFGSNDGSATVSVSGGTPAYSYNWAPSGGFSATASALAAGTYTCTITDANSCSATSSFTITQPSAISATSSQINVSCFGGNNGSATVSASGGTPAYTYSWAPTGGTGATASGLAAGNYTCTITDANSCTLNVTFSITAPSVITTSNAGQNNVSCFGGNDGHARVSASGGTPGYTYDWTPGNPTGDGTFDVTGLTAGTWTCIVTDANSCTTTQTFTITQPPALSVTTSQTDISCNGGNNGSATVSVSGGTPAYTYAWAPSGGTAATASGLTAGNYTCTITDANACTTTATFNITQPSALTASNSQTNVSCFGGNNGSATITPSGGTPAYTYTWAPSGGTAAIASGLAAGNYTCTITDANGCTTTSSVTITQPAPLTATFVQTNVSCNGGSNGSATVTPSGGTPAYTYTWSPSGGTAATASGLAAGTYTCSVGDINGCSVNVTVTITQPPVIVVTPVSQTNVSCNGGSNGSATVSASGGTPGYTYAWTPSGGTAATASGLIAGNYTCTVTDANNCTSTATFSITQPAPIVATNSQTNVSCNGGNNGSATVSVSGGTPAYTYAWTPSGGTGSTASGLTAGNYTCTITDANSCTTTATFSITQPLPLSSVNSQTNVSCSGGNNGSATVSVSGGTPAYTYAWAPSGGTGATASGLTAGNYTCTITDANSCSTTATFSITQPSAITFTSSQTNILCNGGNNGSATVVAAGGVPGYTYAWAPSGGTAATASGLTAGNYTCTITDANGCSVAATFTITQPSAISAVNSQTNVSCFGGSNGTATVTVSGGTPGYAYAWAPSGGTGATASGLSIGTYTCTITDANACSSTATFSITQPAALSTSAVVMNATCFGAPNGQATVTVSGGTPAYTYAWTPSGGTLMTASNLAAGSYTCNVTDANGCAISQSVTITEPAAITAAVSQTDVSCFGGTNGTADVTAGGGTPGYNYLWTPGAMTTSSVTGLTAGSYTCTITDANGCTLDQGINITEPNILAATTTITNVSCAGGSNGTALASATGGTPLYTFNWLPSGGTDSLATGLSAGTYTCTITDVNGCSTSVSVTIAEPSPLSVSSSHTNVTCFGGSNGSAAVVVSGGTPAYTYAWSPSGGTGASATGLTAGTYTCVITDAGGCSLSQTFTIASPASMTATTSQTNVSCNGGSNGTATIIVNGGAPFYSYNWLPSGGTGPIASGLSAGTYTCNVTDANGCTFSQTVLIAEPALLTSSISSTSTNCSQSNGSATVVASGGTAPYTYSWSPSGGNAATANGLLAGTYTCNVTDAHGCTTSSSVTVTDIPAPTLSLVSQTNMLCNGNNTGDATMSAAGGVSPYTYAWTPTGGNTATASSLLAGTYTCTVTDSAGCTGTQTVTITEPSAVTISITSGTILCNGGSTSVNVIAGGGTSPYTGEGTFTDTAGTFVYMVTDTNGCSATDSIIITEPSVLTSTVSYSSVLCNGGMSTITVNANGGTTPYTGTGTFTQPAGTYYFPITDANGCSTLDSAIITEPTVLTVSSSSTSILCNDGSATVTVAASGGTPVYSGDGTFTQTAGTYNYIVTDSNGCLDSTSITITEPTLLTAVIDSVFNPTGCSAADGMIYITANGGTAGYTYLWSDFSTLEDQTGLASGVYSCTITDANGCTTSIDTSVVDPAPPVVTVAIDTVLCAANAPYVLTEGSPAGGTWSGTSVTGNSFDPSVGVGSYTLTYTYIAQNGCSGLASDVMIVDPCTGIAENPNGTTWSAYPNPTYGNVTLISNGSDNKDHLVEVYAADGKLVQSESYTAGKPVEVNMNTLAEGIYMIRITTGTEVSTVRVIKQ